MERVVGEDWIANQGNTQVSGREVDQQPVKRGAELKNIADLTPSQLNFQPYFVVKNLNVELIQLHSFCVANGNLNLILKPCLINRYV